MPILGAIASAISGNLYSASYDSISTVTVGAGGSATITFSSIPNTYKHLQVRMFGQTNRSDSTQDAVMVQFNNDASDSSYTRHVMLGDGSTTSAGAGTTGSASASAAFGIRFGTNQSGTQRWGAGILDILDYTNTAKYTTTRAIGGTDNNSTGLVGISSNLWVNTSVITTIVIKPHTGSLFNQYSSFALYGIKGA